MSLSGGLAEIRARKALQESGLPHNVSLSRANSTRNEVFITDQYVIRFNQSPTKRLYREAELCRQLPRFGWTPQIVAHGGRPGADYLIVGRLPGTSLSRCWPQMSQDQRRTAARQLAALIRDLHALPTAAHVPPIESTPHLLGGPWPTTPLLEALDRLSAIREVDSGLTAAARDLVLQYEDCLVDYDESSLVHGDLTFENVLWDGRRVTAIVDFEWCRGGPADLDLDVLGRFFAIPHAHVSLDAEKWQRSEDYRQVPLWMAEVYPELFAHPRLAERLLIFALAFEVRDLLSSPPPANKRDLNQLHPYFRLDHLVATGGHVTELLDHLDPAFATTGPTDLAQFPSDPAYGSDQTRLGW